MKNVVAFSGGKDSTALILWMQQAKLKFDTIFCDTGWEHWLTYQYIAEINEKLLGGKLITLKSAKYDGMLDLVERKSRVPSSKARFCTTELKVIPMIEWIDAQDEEITLFQGIRADESPGRALLPMRQWAADYNCWVARPLLRWKAEDVWRLTKAKGIEPNPLYKLGAGRVGCFPCVLINHGELKRLMQMMPEVWDRIAAMEKAAGRSFFYPKYIPERFHTGYDPKSNKTFPTVEDVRQYIIDRHDIDENAAPASCMSVYNLCE